MKNKTNTLRGYHTAIRTKHVFIEGERVFLKNENQDSHLIDSNVAEWFPTDFNWVAVRL